MNIDNNDHAVFLACEFKYKGPFFKHIKKYCKKHAPAFIFGKLCQINSIPNKSYIIHDIGYEDNSPILFGRLTILNEEGLMFLDQIKGFYGDPELNIHHRRLIHCRTNMLHAISCWVYNTANNEIIKELQEVKNGLWDINDIELMEFSQKILEKI